MANISKSYGIGDTVWVWYNDSISTYFTPVSRVVSKVEVNSSTNEAVVSFTSGNPITDGATQTIYTTQALANTAVVSDVILKSAPAVTLDATLSGASTSGNASVTLIRKG